MAGGEPTPWFAGAVAAVALLGVLPRIRATGTGELLDVSQLEAAHLEHSMYPVTYASMAGTPFHQLRGVPVPGIEPTADGQVGFFVITGQQWLEFCALIGHPDGPGRVAVHRHGAASPRGRPHRRDPRVDDAAHDRRDRRDRIAHAHSGSADRQRAHDPTHRPLRRPGVAGARLRRFPPAPAAVSIPGRTDRVPAAAPSPGRRPMPAQRGTPPRATRRPRVAAVRTRSCRWPASASPIHGVLGRAIGGPNPRRLGAEVIHIEGPRRPDGIRMNTLRKIE